MANVPAGELERKEREELMVVYATLMLHDGGKEINVSSRGGAESVVFFGKK